MVSQVCGPCVRAGMVLRAGGIGTVFLLGACLADNPPGTTATDSDDSATSSTSTSGTTGGPGAAGMLGCPAGQTCPLVFVSQSLDDRVEVFAPLHPPVYRGSIGLDLKPGTGSTDGTLDEPYGIAMAGGFVHIITGHHPQRESGSMLSFPLDFFAGYAAGTDVPVTDVFQGAFFAPTLVSTPYGEEEPIFLLADDVQGRLLVGTFNNNLFDADTAWDGVGKLIVADAADPMNFGVAELSFPDGDCIGASSVALLGGTQAAVACDGNEAIAFLNVGMIGTGEPGAAAAAITGTLCPIVGAIPGDRRLRYLAADGAGGVLATSGATPTTIGQVQGEIIQMDPNCTPAAAPATIGPSGQLGGLVPLSATSWLVASGGLSGSSVDRGIVAVTAGSTLEACGSVAGFEDAWANEGAEPANPVGLAITRDGQSIAVGAAGPFGGDAALGKVLWAELSGTDDPCTMTATVTNLTDGVGDHAPASTLGDPGTFRQSPSVVVIEEVSG